MSVKEMHEDHFTIDADDLPLDMFQQIDDPFPGCDVGVYFDHDERGLTLIGAWIKGEELKISHKDAIDLIGMIEAYQEEKERDQAEAM